MPERKDLRAWRKEPPMSDPMVFADEIKPGDAILWADHVCRVVSVSHDPSKSRRRGRWLHVAVDNGDDKRLHYFDDERLPKMDGGR